MDPGPIKHEGDDVTAMRPSINLDPVLSTGAPDEVETVHVDKRQGWRIARGVAHRRQQAEERSWPGIGLTNLEVHPPVLQVIECDVRLDTRWPQLESASEKGRSAMEFSPLPAMPYVFGSRCSPV